MNRFSVWIQAARLRTLPASAAPVILASAWAYHAGGFHLYAALAALWGALWIQIGVNFANDLQDAIRGADTPDRVGPTRVVASGMVTPEAMRRAVMIAFGMATLGGVYLIARAGWPVLFIGLASFVAALAYSGGPLPLGYLGLGDLFVFLFFGPVAVLGTEYVQRLQISPGAMGLSLAMGALSTAILIVNNVRDRHTDRTAGKRTLAVRLGKRGSLVEYALCLGGAYGVAVGFAWMERRLLLLLPLLTLPTAVRLYRLLRDQEGRALNDVLAGTARLLLLFALLFSLGLVWSR